MGNTHIALAEEILVCHTPAEAKRRQQAIEGQADELDRIASSGLQAIIRDQLLIEGVFSKLLALGTKAPDYLVSNVAQALVVFEQNQMPIEPAARLDGKDVS